MPLQLKCQDGPTGVMQDSHRDVKTQLACPLDGGEKQERKRLDESRIKMKHILYSPLVMSLAVSSLNENAEVN